MSSLESSMSTLSISSGGSTGSLREVPQLETNVYRISNDQRCIYRCSVSIDKIVKRQDKIDKTKHKEERIQLSRAGGADAIRIPRQRVCCAVMQLISDEWPEALLLYEGAATMFSTHQIVLGEVEIPVDSIKELMAERNINLVTETDFKMFIRDASSIAIKISYEGGMVDISSLVRKSIEENQLIVDFLATLSRDNAPKDRYFAFRGGKLIDQERVKDIQFGHLRAPGISTGVRAVKDDCRGGMPVMALDIDVTEATLFKPQPLTRTIIEYFDAKANARQLQANYRNAGMMREVEKYIRDIVVRYEHTDRTFTVTGFKWDETNSSNGVDTWPPNVCKDEDERKKYEGSAIVTEDVKSKEGKIITRYYPLDGLHVLPNNKVPKEKQKGQKPKPVLPQQRYNAMHQARRDINIENTTLNDAMLKFGTQIDSEPIRVDQERLDAPTILGGAGVGVGLREIPTKSDVHNWNSSGYKYVKGAKIDELYFIFQTGRLKKDQAAEFVKAHVECCKAKGMNVVRHNFKAITTMDDLETTMREFAAYRDEERTKGQPEFRVFLVLVGEKNPVWHDRLKLLEQNHALQTQHIDNTSIEKVLRKPAGNARQRDFTLLNIVMKTNVKAGGENVKIAPLINNSLFPSSDVNSPVTLIVGLDVAHPPPQTRHQVMRGFPVDPSCIGISSNCMTNNLQTFIGYEVFTESRKEAATDKIMTEAGRHLIKKFIENQRRLPDNIVYFRDGVDKGQYSRVKDEFMAMMEGMLEQLALIGKDADFNPREVVVLATKRHNIRAYELTQNGVQNCKAGTVIDTGIVSPYYPEFFLYASHALIGTAKGVQCTILIDSTEEELRSYPDDKLKDMEKFVHALAFGHQVCDSPTSLPEPLYNAHETAKRGAANSKAYKNSLEVRSNMTHEELTKMLSNRDSELGRVKYNA